MKKFRIEVKWSMIYAFMLLFWIILERLFGLHDKNIDQHAIYTNLFIILAIVIYVLALREIKGNIYKGIMTYKQGFKSGLIITLVITILTPFTQWIISDIISPDFFSNMIEYVVQTNRMTTEEAVSSFNRKSYIIQATIGSLVMGILISAVVAFFVKKDSGQQLNF